MWQRIQILQRLRRSLADHPAAVALVMVLVATGWLLSGCSDQADTILGTERADPAQVPATDFSFDPGAVVSVDPDATGGGVELGGGDGSGRTRVQTWRRSRAFVAGKPGTFPLSSSMKLLVAAGSLPRDTVISAQIWLQRTGGVVDWVLFDFLPVMEFLQPLTLRIKSDLIAGTATEDGEFLLWNWSDALGEWELAGKGRLVGRYVEFSISHFSKYAVGR